MRQRKTHESRAEPWSRQDLLEKVLESLPDGVVVCNSRGEFVVWNASASQVIGRGPETVPKEAWSEAYEIFRADGVTPFPLEELPMIRALRGESSDRVPMVLGRPGGPQIQISVSGRPLRHESEAVEGAFVVLMDLTERKRFEEELRESEARYRVVIEQTGQLIYDYDVTSGSIHWDGAIEGLTGHTPAEFQRVDIKGWEQRIHPEDRERALSLLNEALENCGQYRVEYRFQHANGSYFHCEDNGIFLGDERGRSVRMLGAMQDVTARKVAEDERRTLEARLREAQRLEAIGRLAGGVAHDFNNLLMPILGYAELGLAKTGQRSRFRNYFQQIQLAAERARDLTRQLLAFGRRQVLEVEAVDLNRELSRFEPILRRLVREDITLQFELDRELGPVRADVSQLEQILMNLVVNAREAMPRGGRITIRTSAGTLDRATARERGDLAPGDYVMLSVIDTGMGMDSETARRIFEPFFTTKEKGTGLGLATVYGIVKQHGGGIWAESVKGEGTTFTVCLPRARVDPPIPREKPGRPQVERGTETILLAEDDPLVRDLVRNVLGGHGYHVLVARDAREAIRIAASFPRPIDLLVTDVIMPGINGRQLHEALLSSRPDIRVLFISGHSEEIVADHGVLEPGLQLLRKPFSVEQLAARVRAVLAGDSDSPSG